MGVSGPPNSGHSANRFCIHPPSLSLLQAYAVIVEQPTRDARLALALSLSLPASGYRRRGFTSLYTNEVCAPHPQSRTHIAAHSSAGLASRPKESQICVIFSKGLSMLRHGGQHKGVENKLLEGPLHLMKQSTHAHTRTSFARRRCRCLELTTPAVLCMLAGSLQLSRCDRARPVDGRRDCIFIFICMCTLSAKK